MSPNDRLSDELLTPLVVSYILACDFLARLPIGDDHQRERSFRLGQLTQMEVDGERIARVLDVPVPAWGDMQAASLREAA